MDINIIIGIIGILFTIIIGIFFAKVVVKTYRKQRNKLSVQIKNSNVKTGDIVGGDKRQDKK